MNNAKVYKKFKRDQSTERYFEEDRVCPCCDSYNYRSISVTISKGNRYHEFECSKCKAQWVEHYRCLAILRSPSNDLAKTASN